MATNSNNSKNKQQLFTHQYIDRHHQQQFDMQQTALDLYSSSASHDELGAAVGNEFSCIDDENLGDNATIVFRYGMGSAAGDDCAELIQDELGTNAMVREENVEADVAGDVNGDSAGELREAFHQQLQDQLLSFSTNSTKAITTLSLRGKTQQQQHIYSTMSLAEMQQQEQLHLQHLQQQHQEQRTTTLSIFEEHQRQQQQMELLHQNQQRVSGAQITASTELHSVPSNFDWTSEANDPSLISITAMYNRNDEEPQQINGFTALLNDDDMANSVDEGNDNRHEAPVANFNARHVFTVNGQQLPTDSSALYTAAKQQASRNHAPTATLAYEIMPPVSKSDAAPTVVAKTSAKSGKGSQDRPEGHIDRRTRRGKRKLACRTTAITTYPPQPQSQAPLPGATRATAHPGGAVLSGNSNDNVVSGGYIYPLASAAVVVPLPSLQPSHQRTAGPLGTVPGGDTQQQVVAEDDEDLRDHRTVFCSTFGRLNLMNAKERHDVSRAELKRRLAPPECLNMSLLSGILRRAKTKNGGPAFRARLERSGLVVNPGRRPSTRVTLFTSLLEAESVLLARDFVQVVDREFPIRPLAEHIHNNYTTAKKRQQQHVNKERKAAAVALSTNDKHTKPPAGSAETTSSPLQVKPTVSSTHTEVEAIYWNDRYLKLLDSVQILNELRVLLENDRSPIMNRRPTPALTTVAHNSLSRFSNLTHGFGTTAIVGTLKPLEDCIVLMATMAQTKAEQALGASVARSK